MAADSDERDPGHIKLLIVSGDNAAGSPSVRALAESADTVIAVTMFHGLAVGWADVVLPGTAALERDGTIMNLEGRLQKLRRAVIAPVPDELAWIAKLAAQFGVEVSPHAPVVFDELAGDLFEGFERASMGERAPLPRRAPYVAPEPPAGKTAGAQTAKGSDPGPGGSGLGGSGSVSEHVLGELYLLRYRPLFSGPQVERVDELQFLRPEPEAELSPADAERRGIGTGDTVTVRSNGTSLALRARVNRRLVSGVVRVAEEHAGELHATVEVVLHRGTDGSVTA